MILLVVIIILLLVHKADHQNYQDSSYYATSLTGIDSLRSVLSGSSEETVMVGWSQMNITPQSPVRLTGNNWHNYQRINDSIYIRTFLFSDGTNKVALLNYDLWFVHPSFYSELKKSILSSDLGIDQLYITATHTHSSIGGWGSGLLGELVVGGNDKKTMEFLVEKTMEGLSLAWSRLAPGEIGFLNIPTHQMVHNRLLKNTVQVDSMIRMIKLKQYQGNEALFSTFSAHPVFLNPEFNTLSADYPGVFNAGVQRIDSISLSAFGAGTMGSHSPLRPDTDELKAMEIYGNRLAQYISLNEDSVELIPITKLQYVKLPVALPPTNFRITGKYSFRPWVFNSIMGDLSPFIDMLIINDIVLIGLPIELSGEFYSRFDKICAEKGLHLVITIFNGNYLGYSVPEKYYDDIVHPETREMNWYGAQSGEYFAELVLQLLAIIP